MDSEIKEDILGVDDNSLEDKVKAIEAKKSARGNHHFTRKGIQKCPAGEKIYPKCGIQGHYKDTKRCKNPRAVSSRIKKTRTPRNEKHKYAEASELEEIENKSMSPGDRLGFFK